MINALNAKSPLQRAFPGFPYNLLVVVGDNMRSSLTNKFYINGQRLSSTRSLYSISSGFRVEILLFGLVNHHSRITLSMELILFV
jgi:hypothetical protein